MCVGGGPSKALRMTFRFAGHILPTTDILMSDRRLMMTVADMRYKESQSLIWLWMVGG